MEDLRIAGIELPTLRESEVKDLYAEYVDTQILNNVGLKTSSYTNKITQQITPTATLDILDKEGGQNVIKDFLNKRSTVSTNKGPKNAGAKRLEEEIIKDSIDTTLTDKQLTDGWSITDDGKKNLNEKLDIKSINESLKNDPTIENLDKFTKNIVDAVHILKEEAGHEKLHTSTYSFIEAVRNDFAEKFGILRPKNDTFLKKLIGGESDIEDGNLGEVPPSLEGTIGEHPARGYGSILKDKFEEAQEVTKSRQVHMKGWLNLSKEERVVTYEGDIKNYIRAMKAKIEQPSLLSRAS
jgi:hypothetical protein